jgi:hypothetical protein
LFIIYCLFTFVCSLFVCSFVHCCSFIHRLVNDQFCDFPPLQTEKMKCI